ncbi:MAG TPA: DUF1579 domain-containing protein [Chitinophaga sp.]|uniref:DUF1579 domain-containing protein n=1 Tax=Chitinophaga sp. TaxID=1869181 RepID=UPI002C0DD133|nr:DUF1579 domain-containing protein [Chitinophaga sp.]HVI48652.1 DUF1579 domain-containing protein [Chitinophaga sp.]
MKTYSLYFLTAALCLLISTAASAQMDSAAAMKAWMTYMSPGPIHEKMAKGAGEWTTDLTFWEPGNPNPQKTTGECTATMILGGRYEQTHYTGNAMGMAFEGFGTMAYDNGRKKFISTWYDNMGTGIMVMEGTWDDELKAVVLKGKEYDPMTNKELNVREVLKRQDDNHHTMEMYHEINGKEMKAMEIKFTRK